MDRWAQSEADVPWLLRLAPTNPFENKPNLGSGDGSQIWSIANLTARKSSLLLYYPPLTRVVCPKKETKKETTQVAELDRVVPNSESALY
jgi:hypothetical protein